MIFPLSAAAVAAASLTAQPVDNHHLSLTIYNDNLALVQEQRTLDVPAGRTRLEFKDVSASIRPETVALNARGVSIVEQNFDYDLLTPTKLMEKAVGQQVQIVRTNPGNGQQVTETATVLSANAGVVLRIGDRIEVLRDDGVPTRVIFPKVPDNLRPLPTLSVTVEAQGGGPRQATLSYLTTGLSWNADYVALFDEAAAKLDMQGWITLKNTSGTGFADAQTQLIAGDINIVSGLNGPAWRVRELQAARATQRSAGSEGGAAGPLADYYLYPLTERTTVADNQTKQVGFLGASGVGARKAYQFRSLDFRTLERPQHADVVVEFANAASAGLGAPMPAGIVRVYVRDKGGEPKFVGEDRIEHTPQGSELSIKTGEAFDVTVQPTLVTRTGSPWDSTFEMSYLISNARAEPVTVEVRQGNLHWNGEVLAESQKSRRVDASAVVWSVPVPANGKATLTATLHDTW